MYRTDTLISEWYLSKLNNCKYLDISDFADNLGASTAL